MSLVVDAPAVAHAAPPAVIPTRDICALLLNSLHGHGALKPEVVALLLRGYNTTSLGSHRNIKARRKGSVPAARRGAGFASYPAEGACVVRLP